MTGMTMDEQVAGVGVVRMHSVQGAVTVTYQTNQTWTSTWNVVVEGRAPNGDLLAHGINGTGSGRYATGSGQLSETNVVSSGWNYFWRNGVPVNQVSGPILADGVASYSCSAQSLVINGPSYHEEFKRA
ncbi:hypothetical protein AB0K00_56215 [Dactylosporangium sp. NPDC049525]|uniref:hypothetical protein n=1 Tax=Dactylosporangium sp. NPDC049525 TaxID=3154730 RepID=UPI00342F11EF